jgi:arylsulfatase A-like enzyme
MRLPGAIKPGTVVDQFVSQVDFMPTILDYVGLPIPKNIHGRSMRPLIEGKDVAWRDHAFCQRANRAFMLRTARWKYVFGRRGGILALYDLKADPNEDKNLARQAAHAKTVREMHARLRKIMTDDKAPPAVLQTLPPDPLPEK